MCGTRPGRGSFERIFQWSRPRRLENCADRRWASGGYPLHRRPEVDGYRLHDGGYVEAFDVWGEVGRVGV